MFTKTLQLPFPPFQFVILALSLGLGYPGRVNGVHNEAPCSDRGCHCFDRNSESCQGTVHSDFGPKVWACPSQANNVVCCCPGGAKSAAYNEDPCQSRGCHCYDKSSEVCTGKTYADFSGTFACPTQKDSVVCCCENQPKGPARKSSAYNEDPCQGKGCHCYDKKVDSCSGTSYADFSGAFACPTQKDSIICCCQHPPTETGGGSGGGAGIVTAARSQIGLPYVWSGGNQHGPSKGGFDCSGLSQYAVFKGTGKVIPRVAQDQYNYGGCARVSSNAVQPGDIIFWGNPGVYHDGIASGNGKVIHAPDVGQKVKEAKIWTKELMPYARRCH